MLAFSLLSFSLWWTGKEWRAFLVPFYCISLKIKINRFDEKFYIDAEKYNSYRFRFIHVPLKGITTWKSVSNNRIGSLDSWSRIRNKSSVMGLKLCPVDKQGEVERRTPCRANTRNQGEALKWGWKGRGEGDTSWNTCSESWPNASSGH